MFWSKLASFLMTVVCSMSFMYFHVFSVARNFSRWWEIVFLGLAVASGVVFLWILQGKFGN